MPLKTSVALKSAPDGEASDVEPLAQNAQVEGFYLSEDKQWVFAKAASGKEGWIPKTITQTTDSGSTTIDVLDASAITHTQGQLELQHLYQLMGYQIADNAHFNASNVGLPIGPTEGENGKWLYERLIPTFVLSKNRPASSGTSLDPAQDPYLGVRNEKTSGGTTTIEKGSISVENWWQDLYGNPLASSKQDESFEIAYTDPLIGINQWPSVAENYEFSKVDAQNASLQMQLSFDVSSYLRATHETEHEDPQKAAIDKTKAALETYRKAYYQLIQTDIHFEIKTSLIQSWSETADHESDLSKNLIAFVKGVHEYLEGQLSALQNGDPDVGAPSGFSHSFNINFDNGSKLLFPESFIFGLTVRFDIRRNADLIHKDVKSAEHEDVQHALSYLSANVGSGKDLNLRGFAEKFEDAFPGLKLAVSQERTKNNTDLSEENLEGRPLFVVQLGPQGIQYDIKDDTAAVGDEPAFFGLPPLSNALHSAKVEIDNYANWKTNNGSATDIESLTFETKDLTQAEKDSGKLEEKSEKQFDGVDLNILGREFLVAVEDFLRPENVIPARGVSESKVDDIIEEKGKLAQAISSKVAAILERDKGKSTQRDEAVKSLEQQLLVDLVEGFDIETIVNYKVGINIGSHLNGKLTWKDGLEPRIVGKPRVKSIKREGVAIDALELDFSISATKIPLSHTKNAQGQVETYFTYLFDTRTPEKFDSIELDLEFKMTDIEYQLEKVDGTNGIGTYLASSWLSFILPGEADAMGKSAVPIPLRNYPMPPSLILQEALPDPNSEKDLNKIRQWTYSVIYEHIDIAQDAIDCIVELNKADKQLTTIDSLDAGERELLEALVNFFENYSLILKDLEPLQNDSQTPDEQKAIQFALVALDTLIGKVSIAWSAWNNQVTLHAAKDEDLHFEVQEVEVGDKKFGSVKTLKQISVPAGDDLPDPVLELPGYLDGVLQATDPNEPNTKTYEFTIDPNPDASDTFGDSAIPDRRLNIDNLDIIHHQNAWAGVWLSRNKELVDGQATNSVFIFQTPLVQFNNMLTPFLINQVRWDINSLNTKGGPVPLSEHLSNLFTTILPESSTKGYQIRISSRYAFAMVKGRALSNNLLTELPILLGQPIEESDTNDIPANYLALLAEQITEWYNEFLPSEDDASFMFTFSIFSKIEDTTPSDLSEEVPEDAIEEASAGNLPLLKIENLFLRLEDTILEKSEVEVG